MIETTGTSATEPTTTEPGTPVVVSVLVQVGDNAKHFHANATAGPGVEPYRVADALTNALREQVGDFTGDRRYGRVPDFSSDPILRDGPNMAALLAEIGYVDPDDDPEDGDLS